MPHAIVKTRLTLSDVVERFSGEVFQYSDTLVRFRRGFLHLDRHIALLPCLVIDKSQKQQFYVQLRWKGPEGILVRVDSATHVVKTVGVRLALALSAIKISRLDKDAKVDTGNLQDFFEFLDLEEQQQTEALRLLRAKLRPYLRSARRREEGTEHTISLNGFGPPFDWSEVFQNSNPVEIEVGPGKGKFLLSQAESNPDRNFLAVEWAGGYLKTLTERIPRSNLINIRLLAVDARTILKEWIAPGSVARFHIYYPDPWWKKRHEKHRLFVPDFLQGLETALSVGGEFCFATDVEDLFAALDEMMQQSTRLIKSHEKIYKLHSDPPPGRSNFEIKKWQAGSPIFEAAWQKGNAK